jgi:hypothetical protein
MVLMSVLATLAVGLSLAGAPARGAPGEVQDGAALVAPSDGESVRVGPYPTYGSALRAAEYYRSQGYNASVYVYSVLQGLYYVDLWLD